MHQEALTIAAPLDPAQVPAVTALLEQMSADPARNRLLPFDALSDCHFGRLVLFPAMTDLEGQPLDAQLLLLTDCDGAADRHLEALVAVAGAGIDAVFGHARGYPGRPASVEQRVAFLRRHTVRTPANYVHRPGRTVGQIRRGQAARGHLHLPGRRRPRAGAAQRPAGARAAAGPGQRRSIAALGPGGAGGRRRRAPAARSAGPRVPAARAAGAGAGGLPRAPAGAAGLVRFQEARDRPAHLRPTPEHLRELPALEDRFAHSGFTAGG